MTVPVFYKLAEGCTWMSKSLSTVLVALFFLMLGHMAQAQTVWFGPVTDQITPGGFYVNPDYLQLFEDNAAWQAALSRTRVFEIDRRYISTQPEATLQHIFAFLNKHGIALAVIFGFVEANNCGQGVEGTAHFADENFMIARRVARLGGKITYAVVDEALDWGHLYRGKNACQYPIDDLAAGFSRQAARVRSIFPQAELVDTESSSGMNTRTPAEFELWLNALNRYLGDGAPKSVRFDVQWYNPWQQNIPPILAVLRRHGLKYGVIYKGTYLDKTDSEYIAAAQRHIKSWQNTISDPPASVVFQSWERNPSRVLPESSPTTLTYLINWYCAQTPVPGGCR